MNTENGESPMLMKPICEEQFLGYLWTLEEYRSTTEFKHSFVLLLWVFGSIRTDLPTSTEMVDVIDQGLSKWTFFINAISCLLFSLWNTKQGY